MKRNEPNLPAGEAGKNQENSNASSRELSHGSRNFQANAHIISFQCLSQERDYGGGKMACSATA
jgi:hypothetical protein